MPLHEIPQNPGPPYVGRVLVAERVPVPVHPGATHYFSPARAFRPYLARPTVHPVHRSRVVAVSGALVRVGKPGQGQGLLLVVVVVPRDGRICRSLGGFLIQDEKLADLGLAFSLSCLSTFIHFFQSCSDLGWILIILTEDT